MFSSRLANKIPVALIAPLCVFINDWNFGCAGLLSVDEEPAREFDWMLDWRIACYCCGGIICWWGCGQSGELLRTPKSHMISSIVCLCTCVNFLLWSFLLWMFSVQRFDFTRVCISIGLLAHPLLIDLRIPPPPAPHFFACMINKRIVKVYAINIINCGITNAASKPYIKKYGLNIAHWLSNSTFSISSSPSRIIGLAIIRVMNHGETRAGWHPWQYTLIGNLKTNWIIWYVTSHESMCQWSLMIQNILTCLQGKQR